MSRPIPRSADRRFRPRSRQSADQRHRPLQYPLLLLHAGRRRAVHGSPRRFSPFEEIERFVRVARTAGHHQTAAHRRRASAAPRSAPADRKAGRDSRHPRYRADHQRRAAGETRADLYAPVCAGSISISIRWTASASRQITRRDDLPRVLAGIDAAVDAGFREHQVEYCGGEGPGRAGHRSHGALLPRARIRAALYRVHAARCAIASGTAARF